MNNNTGSAFHLNNTARRDLCQSTSNVRFQELIFLTDSNQISPINFKFFCNSYNYTHTTMHTINRVHMDEKKINLKVQQNINHIIFSLYCASIGDCFYSKKVLGEYLISLKRFLRLWKSKQIFLIQLPLTILVSSAENCASWIKSPPHNLTVRIVKNIPPLLTHPVARQTVS